MKEYQVNYRTVRSALKLLEEEGVIRLELRKRAVVDRALPKPPTFSLMYIRWSGDVFTGGILEGISRFCREMGQEPVFMDAYQSHENDHLR